MTQDPKTLKKLGVPLQWWDGKITLGGALICALSVFRM